MAMSKKDKVSANIKSDSRAFELDFLRGLSIVMMILHHMIYDIRYIFGVDAFAWQESDFFQNILRPPFVFIFLFVSGICCTFSRSNYRRSAKLGSVALIFSTVFFVVSKVSDSEMYIVSNVILILAAGTLIYAALGSLENKKIISGMDIWLIAASAVSIIADVTFDRIGPMTAPWFTPLHENFEAGFGMADYMPMFPWISMFFAGALVGRFFYKSHKSLFPGTPGPVRRIIFPFVYVGQRSLLFYLLHQPVILLLLYLMKLTGII